MTAFWAWYPEHKEMHRAEVADHMVRDTRTDVVGRQQQEFTARPGMFSFSNDMFGFQFLDTLFVYLPLAIISLIKGIFGGMTKKKIRESS